ncbi:hypothetical protein MD484_g9102, partial [Candolleomyces efflorescens]
MTAAVSVKPNSIAPPPNTPHTDTDTPTFPEPRPAPAQVLSLFAEPIDASGAPPGFDIAAANVPAEDEQTGAQCFDTLDGDSEDEATYDSPQRQRPGRISKQTHALINEFKGKMDAMVAEYSRKTSRTESNLVSLWGSSRGYTRVHRSSWNKYQIHFADNRVRERARIKDAEATCNKCFIGFKAEYGKRWKEILNVLDEMNMVRRANLHLSSRSTAFDKIVQEHHRLVQRGHVLGFELESPGAIGFWDSLPITSDSVISFLQNYVFDAVARTAQDDSARALQASHPQFFNSDYQFNPGTSKSQTTAAGSSGSVQPAAGSSSALPRREVSPSGMSTTSSAAVKKETGKGGQDNYEEVVRQYLYKELGPLSAILPPSSY